MSPLRLLFLHVLVAASLGACAAGGTDTTPDAGTDSGPYAGPTTAAWEKAGGESRMGFPINALVAHRGAVFAGWGGSGVTSVGGILVSRDEGATWSQLTLPAPSNASLGPNAKHVVNCLGSDGRRLYASVTTEQIVLASDDDGATWQALPGLPLGGKASVFAFLDGKLYAGTGGLNGGSGLYVTSDQGATWKELFQHDAQTVNPTRDILLKDGRLWYGSVNRVYSLANDDLSTLQEAHRNGLPFILRLSGLFQVGARLVAGTGEGIFTTTDGAAWTKLDVAVGATKNAVHVKTAVFGLVGNPPSEQVVLTTDDGATWLPFDQGLTNGATRLVSTGRTLVAADGVYQLWRTPLE